MQTDVAAAAATVALALGTAEMAKRAGASRTALSSVKSGDPGPAIGTYLRVMSVLGVSGELALLAGDVLQPGPSAGGPKPSKPRATTCLKREIEGPRGPWGKPTCPPISMV